MIKTILVWLSVLTISAASFAQTPAPSNGNQAAYVRPNAEKRFKRYVNDTVGLYTWAGIVTVAGFGTAFNNPKEWGKSWDGFGRRVASNFGRNAIKSTAIYALDESLRLDSHFYRSKKRDVGSRIANAFLSTVTSRKPSGKRVLGVPRIAGTYTSDVIASQLWYPARYDWKDGMRNGTVSLGINSMFNLLREFVLKK